MIVVSIDMASENHAHDMKSSVYGQLAVQEKSRQNVHVRHADVQYAFGRQYVRGRDLTKSAGRKTREIRSVADVIDPGARICVDHLPAG